MKKKSIGEVLRDTRERRGLELPELQRMTNIQAKYLQALEYNDFDMIPDKEYARSFLQRYAEVLELDSDVLLDAYDRNTLVAYYDVGDEDDFDDVPRRRLKDKKESRIARYLPLIYLLLLAFLIISFLFYVVYSRFQGSQGTPQSTSYTVITESTSSSGKKKVPSNKQPNPSSSVKPTVKEPQVTIQTDQSGSVLTVAVSQVDAPVTVHLTVKNTSSWVSLTDSDLAGGVTLSSDKPTAKVTLSPDGKQRTLTLGVVSGLTVTVAGKNIDLSALRAQPATVLLTIKK